MATGHAPSQPGRIFTPYAELVRSAQPGDRLLLDDGRIELKVVGRSAAGLDLVVVNGGALGGHKGINAPGVALPPSALTEKDVDDLQLRPPPRRGLRGAELRADAPMMSRVRAISSLGPAETRR